jgi:methyl-accepting chemotaxis protein
MPCGRRHPLRVEEDEVNWTVGRRITTGFGVGAILVITIALVGVWALREVSRDYAAAVDAEREVLLRAVEARGGMRNANVAYLRFILEANPAHRSTWDTAGSSARAAMELLRQDDRVADTQTWDEALRLLSDWQAASADAMALWARGDRDGALEVRSQRVQPLRDRLEATIATGLENAQSRTNAAVDLAAGTGRNSERAIIIALLLALLLFIATAYLLNRAVAEPLQDASAVLATSAAEILATTSEQASGATESLAAVTQTAATVDQVVQTAEQSADRARAVAASAQRAADIGRQGRQVVDTTVDAMSDVREQVSSIGESIVALADQAQAIGEIISTVNDLAEQTNMLALNAAIEAARAGEQGRGFAVVAGEIKNLAEQSKAGTVRVRQILEQIQRATSGAVMVTEQGNRKVGDVTRQVTEAGETIRQLAEEVAAAAQAAAQIAASAGQQSTGMAQIRQAIGSIQQAAQQNLAATRQAEAAAQEVNRAGAQLIGLIGESQRRAMPV